MGKFMRKAKITGEVAIMEVSHQSSTGVRTRAKTLALERLHNSPRTSDSSSSCYLQLRNRRLEKPFAAKSKSPCPCPTPTPKSKSPSPCPSPRILPVFWGFRFCGSGSENNVITGSIGSVSSRKGCREKAESDYSEALPDDGGGVEVSFGENVLEIESRDRNARETTPCSLIRDSENIATPGSTTRPSNSTATNRRMQNAIHRNIPTTNEMEEFFANAEQLQQRMFEEKYNYDPVNDCPLPGRYEWEGLSA